jgi:putative oxidoreductase
LLYLIALSELSFKKTKGISINKTTFKNNQLMKNKILFGICLLFGLLFINSGLNKFFNYMPMPEEMPESMLNVMEAFTTIGWLLPLVGIVEIIAGLLFIIPKMRALGAVMMLPIMVGIVLTHIVNIPDGLPMAIVLMLINLWVLFENREKYAHIIK